MKNYFIYCLIILLITGCVEQKDYIKEYNLKGKAKRMVLNHYKPIEKFGKFEKGVKVAYDITESIINLKCRLISECRFNEKGKRTQGFIYYTDNQLSQRSERTFDENGNIKREIWYDKNDTILRYIEYNYEKTKTTENWLDKNERLTEKIVFKLDSIGNKTEEFQYKKNGDLSLYYKYHYDLNENLVHQDFGMSKKLLIAAHCNFSYNEQKDISSMKFKTFNGKVDNYEFEYKYDSLKNWIQKISIKNSEPYLLTERIIEYY